ncbi:MAG TPA: carbon-nitrogen hydrolase family protein [Planctomycetota bacterium]|nr:carbon-nitrogen hydrolase family protein [Planctomycetota bacterium]
MKLLLLVLLAALGQSASDRGSAVLRMALVNIRTCPSDLPDAAQGRAVLQQNLQRHVAFIERAVAQGAEFVGFPELSINGYRFGPNMIWLSVDGPEMRSLAGVAKQKKIYVSAGLAERDRDGRKWNTQIVIGPDGRLLGRQRKVWLTAEKGHVESSTAREIIAVKGLKMGITICADGSDYQNLKALVDAGANLIYGPHCNSTGSTTAGWYKFRARWGGAWDGTSVVELPTSNDGPKAKAPATGWIASLGVHAALHNHAGRYNPALVPAPPGGSQDRWASGAWFIGPDGRTLAQMPSSTNPAESTEHILVHDVPIAR